MSSVATDGTPQAKRRLWRQVASWTRWLHIYASMFGFATIFFFGVTGLTLNHPAWFFAESTVQYSGLLNQAWLNTEATPPEGWDEYDYSHLIDKLSVAEHLRAEHRLRGAVEDFLAFEDQCEVTFAGPGYAATARIIRDTGAYTVDVTANDLVSVINDLHKGRHSGKAWSWVIDISAILSVFVSATGFLLIFFLRLRCRQGLVVATVGLALLGVFYYVARM